MSDYTDHTMMKDLEKELKETTPLPHLLKVVKALIFENIKLKDEKSREEKAKTHGIDVLFKEEKKEEAATITFENDVFEKYNVTGSMKDGQFIADGTPAKHTTGKPNYPDIQIAKGTVFEQSPDPEGGMTDPWIWKMLSNRESVRSLEEKLELMRSINIELVDLIKAKLL